MGVKKMPEWRSYMSKLKARFQRFLHCLFKMHRPYTEWEGNKTTFIGCHDCKKPFWGKPFMFTDKT